MNAFGYQQQRRFVVSFTIIFYILAAYKLCVGMWMFQIQPQFFNTRFDFTTWLFMKTGIHKWLLGNQVGWFVFDVAFYGMPFLYWLAFNKNKNTSTYIAVAMLVVNWMYVQCYTLYSTN